MKVKVLGVDPGLLETGWGIVSLQQGKLEHIASGTIKTKANEPISNRLLTIHNEIQGIVKSYSDLQEAAIENTYVNSNYGSSLKLAHARAAALLSLAISGVKVAEYQAKTIKKSIVGHGKADKLQVKGMLSLLFKGMKILNDNQADAVSVAICHLHHLKF